MTPEAQFEASAKWARGIARRAAAMLPRSFELADLEQSAMLALWRCCLRIDLPEGDPRRYDPSRGPFEGVYYRTVFGSVLMTARGPAYRNATAAAIEDTHPAAGDLEMQAALARRRADVRRYVDWLDDPAQTVIRLRFWGDARGPLSIVDIGRVTGIKVPRVRQALADGQRQLMVMILEQDPALLNEPDLVDLAAA